MNTDSLVNSPAEEEPRELRQAFGWLNPIFRTLSFLPLLLAMFGLIGTSALRSQQGFLVSYSKSPQPDKIWSGKVDQIDFINQRGYFLPPELPTTDYFLQIHAQLPVQEAEDYRFLLESDDGSWLFIDGEQIIENGGRHRLLRKEAIVHLTPGLYDLQVDYRQFDMEHILRLLWQPPHEDFPQVLQSPNVYLPEGEIPAATLGTQRVFSFIGVLLLLVQVWALVVIVACFPSARKKMGPRLVLIVLLGGLAFAQLLIWSHRWSESIMLHELSLPFAGLFAGAVTDTLESLWTYRIFAQTGAFILFSSAVVGIQYRLGKDMYSSRLVGLAATATVAAAMVAITMFGQNYQIEYQLFGSLALLFSWRLARQDIPRRMDMILLAICVVLGLPGYFVFLPFFAGCLVFLYRRYRGRQVLINRAIGLVLVGSLVLVFIQWLGGGFDALLHSPTPLMNIVIAGNFLLFSAVVRRTPGELNVAK